MALLVVGVVITIGLSILELTIKQVQLATTARDSEIAFHAANAGMECSRYIRRAASSTMERGQNITPSCFGQTATTNTNSRVTSGVTGDGEVFLYNYSFTWGVDGDRCTQVTTLVASTTLTGTTDVAIANMPTIMPGYTDGNTKTCEIGARCTVMSVRGYNRACNNISNYGTVQREVLLQF